MTRPKMGRGDGAVGDYVQEMNAYAAALERDRSQMRALLERWSAVFPDRPGAPPFSLREETLALLARIDEAGACPYCKGTGVVDNSDFGYGGDTAVCLNCDAHLAAPRGGRIDGAGGGT